MMTSEPSPHRKSRFWLWVLLSACLLLPLAVGAVIWASSDADSGAMAMLRMRRHPETMMRLTGSSSDSDDWNSEKFAYEIATQSTLLTSGYVIEAALRDPEIANLKSVRECLDSDGSFKGIEKRLSVERVENSEVMIARFRHRNQEEAAKLLNAIVKAYMKNVVHEERTEATRRLETLRETARDIVKRMVDTRKTINLLEATNETEERMLAMVQDDRTRVGQVLTRLEQKAADIGAELAAISNEDLDVSEVNSELSVSVGKLKRQQSWLHEQILAYQAKLEELTDQLAKVHDRSTDIDQYRLDLDDRTELLKRLQNEINQTQLEMHARPRIEVLQWATMTAPDDGHDGGLFTSVWDN